MYFNIKEINMKFTVFTPTFNRAKTIVKLYESLKKQNFKDFEWVIVDDGSKDDTALVVNNFIQDKILNIRYYKKINGGKHTAINKGLELAQGEYFFIVDSDDWLPEDSLEIANKWIETLDDDKIIAVGGIRAYSSKKYIGTTFIGKFLDCKSTERKKYGLTGDKAELWKTDFLNQYRFPEFNGENFLSECVVWNKISLDGYKVRWFNEIIYYCEYLEGGLTNTKGKFFTNYQGFIELVSVNQKCKEISYCERLKELVICCVYAKKKKYDYVELAKKLNTNKIKIAFLAFCGNLVYKMLGGSVNE